MKRFYFSLLFLGLTFNSFAEAVTASAPVLKESAASNDDTTKLTASKPVVAKKDIISGVFVNITSCGDSTPCGVVNDTTKKVLDAVNKGVPQNETVTLINTAAAPQFDFNLMTRYALGNNWKLATPEQQQQLVDLFKDLLIYTYSTALSKFKGAQITLTSSTITDAKKSNVISEVLLPNANPNAQPIKVEYDLAKISETSTWKAYDIKIENASLITTYRNQFNEVVQSSKIEGLIKQLQTKVDSLKAKSSQ